MLAHFVENLNRKCIKFDEEVMLKSRKGKAHTGYQSTTVTQLK